MYKIMRFRSFDETIDVVLLGQHPYEADVSAVFIPCIGVHYVMPRRLKSGGSGILWRDDRFVWRGIELLIDEQNRRVRLLRSTNNERVNWSLIRSFNDYFHYRSLVRYAD